LKKLGRIKAAAMLVKDVNDGGGLLGEGGEEGGGISREILARRQGERTSLEH
jgi:hypothetical protein